MHVHMLVSTQSLEHVTPSFGLSSRLKKNPLSRTGTCTSLPVAEHVKGRLRSGAIELPILDSQEHRGLWTLPGAIIWVTMYLNILNSVE